MTMHPGFPLDRDMRCYGVLRRRENLQTMTSGPASTANVFRLTLDSTFSPKAFSEAFILKPLAKMLLSCARELVPHALYCQLGLR